MGDLPWGCPIHCEGYMVKVIDDREGWGTWKNWKNEWKQANQQHMKEKLSEKSSDMYNGVRHVQWTETT